MLVFISHNSADKDTARLLGSKLTEQGINVWFDEWKLAPGNSIVGGIEQGISGCDAFVLVWSRRAQKSNWVATELRAMLVRRVADTRLRVIPLMLDATPLPALVADFKGFALERASQLESIAAEIAGNRSTLQQAKRMQRRLLELVAGEFPATDAIRSLLCPNCGSRRLSAEIWRDPTGSETIYEIGCSECNCRQRALAERSPRARALNRRRQSS